MLLDVGLPCGYLWGSGRGADASRGGKVVLSEHADTLLERGEQLQVIRELLDRSADGAGSLLVVEGPPGTGKTELLDEARLHAAALGMRCLAAYGAHAERGYTFSVVRQLIAPLLLPDAESWASGGSDEVGLPDGVPTSAKMQWLHRLIVAAAAERPLAILVDDAHWADAESFASIAYLMRRLSRVPALVVLAARRAEGAPERGLLGSIRADPLTETLALQPLSEAAVAVLVEAIVPWASPGLVAACHRMTGGVPRSVHQTATALASETADPEPDVLSVAVRAIRPTVEAELASLGPDPSRAARALAIMREPSDLAQVAAVAQLEIVHAAEAIDVLADAGLVRADPLGFVEPLVRMAVEASLPMAEAVRAHGRAAASLRDHDPADPSLAHHLAASAPSGDADVVKVLRGAARVRAEKGMFTGAARLLMRALDEPAPAHAVPALLTELGIAQLHSGDISGAERVNRGLSASNDPVELARNALGASRAFGLMGRARTLAPLLERAIAEVEEVDEDLADALEVELIAVELDGLRSCGRARERLSDVIRGGAGVAQLLVAALTRALDVAQIEPDRAAACDHARNLADPGLFTMTAWRVPALAAACLAWCGEIDHAMSFWDRAIEITATGESALLHAFARASRASVALRLGDLETAEDDARASLALVEPETWGYDAAARPLAVLLDVLLERGDHAEAARVLPYPLRRQPLPGRWAYTSLLASRGRLAMREHRAPDAADDFFEVGRRLRAWAVHNPEVIPWRSYASDALIALRDVERARELAREELDLARGFGSPLAIGIALGAWGRVERGPERIRLLAEAAQLLEASPARLAHARALVAHGEALRLEHGPDAARPVLLRALEAGERCGAERLTQRAREELVLAGGRLRRGTAVGPDALTSTQRRVAELAASGMTNRAIAGELAVTAKTVETHLTRAFRKLGIVSRTQLTRALSEDRPAPGRSA